MAIKWLVSYIQYGKLMKITVYTRRFGGLKPKKMIPKNGKNMITYEINCGVPPIFRETHWNRQVHPGIPRPCVIFFKVRLVQRFFPWYRQVLHGFWVSTLAFKSTESPRKNHWATACCLKLSTPRYTSRSRRSIDKCCWTISGVLPWRCFINASLATKTCKQFSVLENSVS